MADPQPAQSVDVTNHHFHVDHVFPRSRFTKARLKKAGVPEPDIDDFREMMDYLPNLQLLEGLENVEKQATMPAEWLEGSPSPEARTNYCDNHLLGQLPESLLGFREFHDARKAALRFKIVALLGARKAEP